MYHIIYFKTIITVKTLSILISIADIGIIVILFIMMTLCCTENLNEKIRGFMLETAEERVKLLKAGLLGNEIEGLYIENNNFKIVGNILYDGMFIETESDGSNKGIKIEKKDNTSYLL